GNICDSNNIQNSASLGGSGLNFYSTATTSFQTIKVKRNIVRGNLWGVTIQGNAKPNFGDISAADTNLIGLNQFYGNTNSSQPNIDFFNNTPDSIKAENNYWGTVNLDTIELHIFHKPDSSALGFVDYLPIMTLTPVISPEISTPKSFKLYEAYPNPFNPSTEVKFDVFTASMVSIKVYDITGRLMGGLVNDYRLPGSYKVNLDAGKLGLTSGVYFIQMNAGNFTQTHKALLIK
ncbi:MAG TPA: T9SS type A sorting domain-containing protein, partial [Ignavibacteria bacterium]|nr:T9SS type A sorting domain-containing protein [Ignavibacteria bacterium]